MATSPVQTYEYDSVSRDYLETHLLILQPGLYDDDIRIILSKTRLSGPDSEVVDYEALSYAWGTPSMTHTATVLEHQGWPGGILPITSNMDTALRCLRLQDRPRALWIDALCISQSNVQERNHQVQWMDQVYKKARRVIVYLGPASDSDAEAVDILTSIGKCINIEESSFNPQLPLIQPILQPEPSDGRLSKMRTLKGSVHAVTALRHLSHNRAFIKLSDQHVPPEYIKHNGTQATALDMTVRSVLAFNHLIQRPWFTRLWVIQEVRSMREPNEGILQYGTRAVSWEHFRKGVVAFRHLIQVQGDSQEAALSNQSHLTTTTLMLCHREAELSVKDFLSLHHFHCADPRDRLYGVLSLVRDDLGYPLPVDYDRATEAVFEDFQRQELQVRGLWLLQYCHLDPQKEWNAPSWVPNQLSFPTHWQEIKDVPTTRFTTDFEFVGDRCLKVYGHRVATVRTVVKCPPLMHNWSATDGPASLIDWLNQVASGLCEGSDIEGIARQEHLASKILGLCDIRGDYTETHIPAFVHDPFLKREHMKAIIRQIFSLASSTPLDQPHVINSQLSPEISLFLFVLYVNLLRAFTYSSRPIVFNTDTDVIGYGPASTLPGDQVCTILGSRTDLLLRPVPGGERHVIVGPVSLASNIRSEAVLGPLPSHIFQVLDRAQSRHTFHNSRTGAVIHDPRLEKLGLKEVAEGLRSPHIRRDDIRLTAEELRLRGMDIGPFFLE